MEQALTIPSYYIILSNGELKNGSQTLNVTLKYYVEV